MAGGDDLTLPIEAEYEHYNMRIVAVLFTVKFQNSVTFLIIFFLEESLRRRRKPTA